MGIGTSIFLIAIGAILAFAIDVDSSGGVNINTVGIILMIAGAIGLLVFMTVFSGSRRGGVRDEVVVEERRIP